MALLNAALLLNRHYTVHYCFRCVPTTFFMNSLHDSIGNFLFRMFTIIHPPVQSFYSHITSSMKRNPSILTSLCRILCPVFPRKRHRGFPYLNHASQYPAILPGKGPGMEHCLELRLFVSVFSTIPPTSPSSIPSRSRTDIPDTSSPSFFTISMERPAHSWVCPLIPFSAAFWPTRVDTRWSPHVLCAAPLFPFPKTVLAVALYDS